MGKIVSNVVSITKKRNAAIMPISDLIECCSPWRIKFNDVVKMVREGKLNVLYLFSR